ncbi:MAG TPA: ABC transporter permease [Gammaproteobacteria bacterium]|nr:ABC transporter permease [Gammaproteobacteria bacterium]
MRQGDPVLQTWSDVRYAVRRLSSSPGFVLAAVLTVALGVGLNAGVFSVLNGAVLRDLPVPGADALVDAYQSVYDVPSRVEKGARNARFTTAELETYRSRSDALAGVMGYSLPWPAALGGDAPREITGRYVTCNYFDVLRQPPAMGRSLTADDCRPGSGTVVVLSHAFWSAAYAADPSVVGRAITMNGQSVTVIGIAAADAYQPGLRRLDYYVPITAQPILRPDRQWLASTETGWLELLGRRRDGSTIAQVRAELGVIAADLDRAEPGRRTAIFVERAKPITFRGLGNAPPAGKIAAAVFGLVLLIACANVANLLLARGVTRAGEIAVRRALGASRGRIVRQLLTEALIVAGVGGVVGSVLAVVSTGGLLRLLLSSSPLALPAIALDVRVLSFALVLSFATGIACGLAPALHVSRPDLHAAAKLGVPGTGRRGDGWLRNLLIGAQTAVCTVLLIGAGLLLRGLYATHTVDPGFPYRSVTYVPFELRGFGYGADDIAAFHRALAERVGTLPGVEGVGFAADVPLEGSNMSVNVRVPGSSRAWQIAERNFVTPGYFSAAGIPLVLGRTFTEAEQQDTSTAVIVTESTARNLWPDGNPIGRTLARRVGADGEALSEVVGVARDAQVAVIGETPPYYVYQPASAQTRHQLQLVVRGSGDAAVLAAGIRGVVQRLDPRIPAQATPIAENLADWQRLAALVTALSLVGGALALALAAVGIYGVVTFVVARRSHEMGVRIALGAQSGCLLRLILGQTMRPVAAGAAVGVLAAAASSQLLTSVLFGVSPLDPVGIAGAVAFLFAVALLASLPAARRALRVDPLAAIRYE